MSVNDIPTDILNRYEVHEWKHAIAVLKNDFNNEFIDIMEILRQFALYASDVITPGGRKSPISNAIDSAFYKRGWIEKKWNTKILIDDEVSESPTHNVDCYKNHIAVEIEWSNKDPFYDRDLNNFRLLFDLRAISVGVIITKSEILKQAFKELHVHTKFGASTTWMSKLIPRIEGGGGGGCPILVFGIKQIVWDVDQNDE